MSDFIFRVCMVTIAAVIAVLIGVGVVNAIQIEKETITIEIDTNQNMRNISEWISPDGVHYWQYEAYSQFALAPRYDKDGNLVIE